jgi:hypothetical protein
MYKSCLGTTIFLLFSFLIFSQQDFNNYKTLKSVGDVPADFYKMSSEKVDESISTSDRELSKKQAKIFFEGVNYGLDELLHSGQVLYGDEISSYVSEVADKLLLDNPKLRKRLRFYTIKSNVTNALSTSQGIILVTTGLISQLTSEAQLAYILAHEISHFTEDHVIETYEYHSKNRRFSDQIKEMSIYSKEKEFEADYKGVELYHDAGYGQEYITSVFDVLMYSYLPIDEIPMKKDYFNTDLCYIPPFKFPEESYEIKAIENYDDSRSSHPNVKRRKEKAVEAAADYTKWGDTQFALGKERFTYIRQLARFESLRTDLLNASYGSALYTILILEKEFPNSLYLNRMKAQSWLGLMAYKAINEINETIKSKGDWEGESSTMHAFIKSLKSEEMASLGMRFIEDCRKTFPNDKEINAVWKNAVKRLAESDNFTLSNYTKVSFIATADSIASIEENPTEDKTEVKDVKVVSKYDRIKKKKDLTNTEGFDSTMYYRFNLSDLMNDETFLSTYRSLEEKIEDERAEKEKIDNMSKKEYKKYKKEKQSEIYVDLSNFILVEPYAHHYKKSGSIKYQKSEELQNNFREACLEAAEDLDLRVHSVSKADVEQKGTQLFNDKALFTSFLVQVTQQDELKVFPVDYTLLNQVKETYGSNKLLFSIIEHNYAPKFTTTDLYMIMFPFIIPYRTMNVLIKGFNTEINLIVLDIDTVEVETGFNRTTKDPVSKLLLHTHMLDILNQLNTK